MILPETLGSIAYLSKKITHLKKRMKCGINLSCVGDERAYSHVESRKGGNLADKAIEAGILNLPNAVKYSYLKRGSDERNYCAPGIDLPLCTFCRTKFGEYPEYHTHLDNFDVVTKSGLEGSFNVIKNIIDTFEFGLFPKTNILGEPQLGKRGLYPNTMILYDGVHPAEMRKNIISYCDGETSIFDICKIINTNLKYVLEELKLLKNHNIIDFV